ncbi:MAG: filamentous hemagglutinin N-terminal domain-containing protein, partial [Sedimentisphaerales bacterium]|nr:filamentous hemagglutinin N-terminal domain-containing protein [Sedimentisphaerales bacterium]
MRLNNRIVLLCRRHRAWLMLFCIMLNSYVPLAMAGPEGAQVVNGQASFQQSGLNTTITASNQAIINYSSFNIAQPEVVQFVQPSSNASVLNRILSANPTNIDGTLLANGRVFFVNPAGIYIGAGAMINVNQLVASGLNISNADFIGGRYSFAGGNGVVANHGDIVAQKAYLIGRQIINSGTINCPDGYVLMASGDRVFLGEAGSNLMVSTDVPASSEAVGSIEGAAVLNAGSVEVGSGEIAFVAAGDLYAQAISNVGTLSASADSGGAGSVNLTAAEGTVANIGSIRASSTIAIEGATVDNSGSLDVSSRTARMNGGNISITGGYIKNWGTIRANAADYSKAGNISVVAQQELTLEQTSRVEAKGREVDSRGGDIYLYSHGSAQAKNGQVIDVSGGTISGDGGRGELSAAKHVSIAGSVLGDVQEGYKRGGFTVDPQFAEVGGTYSADTVVWAEDDITITDNVLFGDGSLSILADHKSETSGEWDDSSGTGTPGKGSITRTGDYTISGLGTLSLKAAEDIGTSSDPIQTNVGALDVEIRDGYNGNVYIAEADQVELAGVEASGGSSRVQITATTGDIAITGPVKAGTNGYYIEAEGGNILFNANGIITGGGPSDLRAAGSIVNEGSSEETIIETTDGGDLYLGATIAANSTQPITISSGGSLELNAPLGANNSSAETTLRAGGALDIKKSVKAQSIEVHSGWSGTGNLAFGPGVTLDAPTIRLGTGDGTGGSGTGAQVDLSTAPTI